MDAAYRNSLFFSLYNTAVLLFPSVSTPFLFSCQQWRKNCLRGIPKYIPRKMLSTRLPLPSSFWVRYLYCRMLLSPQAGSKNDMRNRKKIIFILNAQLVEAVPCFHCFWQLKRTAFFECPILSCLSLLPGSGGLKCSYSAT